jgi:hypothetical protein
VKNILIHLLSWIGLTLGINAAIRSDVVVIEASEGVQYSVQEIAKDYLLGYIYPAKYSLKKNIYTNIKILDANIKKIATNTQDKKSKGILSYFSTQKAQVTEFLDKKQNRESVETMVGFSELFTEGSKSIAKQHHYSFENEEKMLMLTKEMTTLVGGIVKYYIAIEINPDDKSNKRSIEKFIRAFNRDLKRVNQYTYSSDVKAYRASLNRLWRVMTTYLSQADNVKVPALLSILSKDIQKSLDKLSVYHSKSR